MWPRVVYTLTHGSPTPQAPPWTLREVLAGVEMELRETDNKEYEDISYLARWRLSTYKEGYGLSNLLDNDTGKYWQSDGEFPHFVEIQFSKLVQIKKIEFFCSSARDNSYAPKEISISAGFGHHDLILVRKVCFSSTKKIRDEWFPIDLDNLGPSQNETLECTTLRFNIEMNFFHGKDSHVRGLRIFGPRAKRGIKFQRI